MFGKKNDDNNAVTIEQMGAAYAELMQGQQQSSNDVKALSETVKQLTQTVSALAGVVQNGQSQNDRSDERNATPPATQIDIDEMSNGELAAYILNEVKTVLGEAVKPVQESVESVQAQRNADQTNSRLDAVAGQYKDFRDWIPEMTELAKQGISKDPETLYHEARRRNGDKALDLDKQYEQNGQEKFEEGADENQQKELDFNNPQDRLKMIFGGMAPTSTGGDAEAEPDFANAREAGDAAFEDAFEGLNDALYN